jgi:AraC family transcriptional regulator, regulatory protein of adaptative response / DNA-3-methyladenine glycosylase II
MNLAEQEMWESVLNCDATMDGRFLTGVHSTGIYCLPSCRARKPKRENVRFYADPRAAEEAGLRACKKCRPDAFYSGENETLDRLEATILALFASPGQLADPTSLAEQLGCSTSTLQTLCRTHFHETPGSLISRARLEDAQRRLLTTSDGAVEVGIAAGFESSSAYYDRFRAATGLTPTEYRRLSSESQFELILPDRYPLAVMRSSWERDPQSVTDRWEGDTWTIAAHGSLLTATFGENVRVTVHEGSAVDAHTVLARVLNLARDPGPFERAAVGTPFETLVQRLPGLRIPQTPTLYEGLVWSILGQQVNLAFCFALRRRLCELAGTRRGDLFEHPGPERVAKLSVEELLPLQFSQRKAEYVITISQEMAEGRLNLEYLAKGSATRAYETLIKLRGIGPWSANYVLMRAFGFGDGLPVGDTGLTSGLQRVLNLEIRPDVAETTQLMEPIRPYRSLATMHLWKSLPPAK